MKILNLLVLALVFPVLLFSQNMVTFEGHVFNFDGDALEGVDVQIFDSTSAIFISTMTDVDGFYSTTAFTNKNEGQAIFVVLNCNFEPVVQVDDWSAPDYYAYADFYICHESFTSDSCFLFIDNGGSVGGIIELYAAFVGQEPYTFEWNTGETTQSITPPSAGDYCVTATDASGCIQEECIYYAPFDSCFTEIIPEPMGDSLSSTVLFAFTLGQPPYTYLWSDGSTDSKLAVTEYGLYCVTVTDAGGCTSEACYEHVEQLVCEVEIDVIEEADGSFTLTALGSGEEPVQYIWQDNTIGQVINVVSPGFYCVMMTDAAGCVADNCTWVEEEQFCEVWVENTATGLTANAFGEDSITYIWNTGETTQMITPSEDGLYCVTITDGTGCISESCSYWQGDPLDTCFISMFYHPATSSGNDSLSENLIIIAVPFGVPPYTFEWSNGETSEIITVPNEERTYCVTVTDATGCVTANCIDIEPLLPSCEFYLSVDYDQEFPPTSATLSAVTWGDLDFQFLWNTGETTGSIVVDEEGEYCVTVSSDAGCSEIACTFVSFSIDSFPGYIFGTIDADPSVLFEGQVFAYSMDASSEAFELVDSALILEEFGSYYYFFEELPVGDFLFKAVPNLNTPAADFYVPTYHVSSATWTEADIVSLPNPMPVGVDIEMLSSSNLTGPGSVIGKVTNGNGWHGGNTDRLVDILHVEILLFDAAGNVLAYRMTDGEGIFDFSSLPFGTYKVQVEVPGLPIAYYWVTLNEDDPNDNSGQFIITKTEILLTANNNIEVEQFKVFPNPAIDNINLDMEITNEDRISMYNHLGENVSINQVNSRTGSINIGKLPSGIYTVLVTKNKVKYLSRFIKL